MAAGLITSGIDVGAAAIAADIDTLRLHTADPTASAGTTFLTTAADKAVTCSSSGGVVTVPSTSFTGGAASGPCTWVSVWHSGTYRGAWPLTGDQTFNASGNYTVTAITITGSSS